MSRRSTICLALALTTGTGHASEAAVFGALGFPGDGFTPSFQDHHERHTPTVAKAQSLGAVSGEGALSRSFPVQLPPALLAPSITLSYSSQDRAPTWLASGWSLNAGASIRRPSRLEQSQLYADLDEIWLYAGPGGQGPMLFNETNRRWELQTGGNIVTATFDEAARRWVVTDGRRSLFLNARVPGTPVPRSYRIVEEQDLSGNRIRYAYDGHRLEAVRFGGTVSGEADTVRVTMRYDELEPVRVRSSWGEGIRELYDQQLTDVVVESRPDGGDWTVFGGLSLSYERVDDSDRITSIAQRGSDGTSMLPLANFAYEPLSGEVHATSFDEELQLNQSVTQSNGRTIPVRVGTSSLGIPEYVHKPAPEAVTRTRSRLQDMNGDGLPDLLRRTELNADGSINTRPDGWSEPDFLAQRERAILDGGGWTIDDELTSLQRIPGSDVGLDEMHSMLVASEASAHLSVTFTDSLSADINGDGRLDIIQAGSCGYEAVSWEANGTGDADAITTAPGDSGSFSWSVRYGDADPASPAGVVSAPQEVASPLKCPSVAWSGGLGGRQGQRIRLLDLNADGWLDLVFEETLTWAPYIDAASTTDPDVTIVGYLKLPGTDAGWSSQRLVLSGPQHSDLHHDMARLDWSHSYTRPVSAGPDDSNIVGYSESSHLELNDDVEVAGFSSVARQFMDLNGDGFVDFVVAAGDHWRLYAGSDQGFAETAMVWSLGGAEVTSLSYTQTLPGVSGYLVPGVHMTAIDIGDPEMVLSPEGGLGSGYSPNGGAPIHVPITNFVDTATPPAPTTPTYIGSGRSWLEVGLQDVDADGLVDLVSAPVDAPVRWWKNLGSGFSAEQCSQRVDPDTGTCPEASWLAGGLHNARTYVDNSNAPSSRSEYVDHKLVTDFNGDGVLDVIDAERGELLLGSYPKPGTLVEIDNTMGGIETYAYSPATAMAPAGDPTRVQRHAGSHALVVDVQAHDTIDGDRTRTTYSYEGGVIRGGRVLGFTDHRATVFEPKFEFDALGRTFEPETDVDGNVRWYVRSKTATANDLTRVGAFPTVVTVFTDHNLSTIAELGLGGPNISPRYRTETVHTDVSGFGDGSCADQDGHLPRCMVDTRQVNTFPETLVEPADGFGPSATMMLDYTFDRHGLLQSVVESDPSTAETVTTSMAWAFDDDATRAAPMSERVVGQHMMVGPQTLLEVKRWSYGDAAWGEYGDGLMTAQDVCASEAGMPCSEAIMWTFERTDRGAIEATYGPKGSNTTVHSFQFGGALAKETRNALGHATVQVVDAHGRLMTHTDPNGVVTTSTYDPFGRPDTTTIQGQGGTARLTHDLDYDDQSVPRSSTEQHFSPEGGTYGSITRVMDGYGAERQTLQRVDDGEWLSTETLVDGFGHTRFTTVPQSLESIATQPTSPVDTRSSFDATGARRVHYDDYSVMPDCFISSFTPRADTTVSVDQSGRARRHVRDAFGRVIEVFEHEDAALMNEVCNSGVMSWPRERVATYQWSGLDQLQSMSDAADTDGTSDHWLYDHDMAGRLQRVFRASGSNSPQLYAAYDFEDGQPTRMYRGGESAQHLAVAWSYDDLGRPEEKRVRDPGSTSDVLTWPAWITEWDGEWYGKKDREQTMVIGGIPQTTTEWRYDGAAAGDVGNLGNPSLIERHFVQPDVYARFEYEVDLYGEPIWTRFPSGSSTEIERNTQGRPATIQLDIAGVGTDSLALRYDDMGLSTGFTSTATQQGSTLRWLSPSSIDTLGWGGQSGSGVAATHEVGLSLGADHRLTQRSYGLGFVGQIDPTIDYRYDLQGRLRSVRSGTQAETYAFDAMGNLQRADYGGDEEWVYQFPRPLNEPTTRVQRSNGLDQALESSFVNPVTGWVNRIELDKDLVVPGHQGPAWNFLYDGAGKLRDSWDETSAGIRRIRYRYDAQDVLVEKLHSAGPGAIGERELYFDAWQAELDDTSQTQVYIETLTPGLRVRTTLEPSGTKTDREWLLREIDGRASATFSDTGELTSATLLGAYGRTLSQMGATREEDGLHGMEFDGELGLTTMGVRHMSVRDGTWLQPEPLLHLGPPIEALLTPRDLFGPYASGDPINLHDRGGENPLLLILAKEVGAEAIIKAAYMVSPEVGVAVETILTFTSPRRLAKEISEKGLKKGLESLLRGARKPRDVGPNGGRRPTADQRRVLDQQKSRAKRRESSSRNENGQNQKGDGSRDHENANRGKKGERPKGDDGKNRERNVGHPDAEEHSRVHKGTGGRGPRSQ